MADGNTPDAGASMPAFTAKERAFHALEAQLYDQVNILKCAWYALDASTAVDADTLASEARSVVFVCEQKLRGLIEEMDGWDSEHGTGERIRREYPHRPKRSPDISPELADLLDTINANPDLHELFDICMGLDDEQINAIRAMVAVLRGKSHGVEVSHG